MNEIAQEIYNSLSEVSPSVNDMEENWYDMIFNSPRWWWLGDVEDWTAWVEENNFEIVEPPFGEAGQEDFDFIFSWRGKYYKSHIICDSYGSYEFYQTSRCIKEVTKTTKEVEVFE